MIRLTTEQAQQIEEALEDIVRVFKFETGTPVEALASIRAARAQEQAEPKCNPHPDAPHGFDRNASHSANRYVCECEGWEPEQAEQEPLDDDARDNMLLWMIQRHFPSLPLSDEHTDWGRWLGFANAVFEAGRKDAAPVRTKDLTDAEVEAIMVEQGDLRTTAFARAVIAADRSKV